MELQVGTGDFQLCGFVSWQINTGLVAALSLDVGGIWIGELKLNAIGVLSYSEHNMMLK